MKQKTKEKKIDKKAEENDLDYYIATKDESGEFLIYASELFKLSEIDFINLIKICLILGRSKAIGKKILSVYQDSTQHRQELTEQRLNAIGVTDNGSTKPIKERKLKYR